MHVDPSKKNRELIVQFILKVKVQSMKVKTETMKSMPCEAFGFDSGGPPVARSDTISIVPTLSQKPPYNELFP